MAENSILIRLIDLSKSLYSIIYDDTVVSTDKEGGSSDDYFGRVIYYANGDDNFFITNLGYQDQMAKIY